MSNATWHTTTGYQSRIVMPASGSSCPQQVVVGGATRARVGDAAFAVLPGTPVWRPPS